MKRSCFALRWLGVWLLVASGEWVLAAAPVAAASAAAKLVLVVPHRVLFTVAVPVYVAEERGFYKESGIEVDVVFTKGGGENVQAVVAGDANIGLSTGFFSVMSAFEKGAPVKIISAEITGMDAFWYALGTSPIRKLEDLAGKKIAYSLAGSSTHMAALAIADQLKAKGLKPAEPISLGGIPDSFTGVKTGHADAGWSVPPFMLDRVEKGEVRIVVRGNDVAALKDITLRVNFVNTDFAGKNPQALRGFLRAHQRAIDFIFDNPKETAKIWMKRADLKLPEAIVLKTWDFYQRSEVALKSVRGVQPTMQDAIKFKFLKKALTQAELDRLIDLSYLP